MDVWPGGGGTHGTRTHADDEEISIRWTVAYDRSVGQAVIQFHGPPRAFSAVRMVDVCFHPEAQFSGTVPLGMVVAASRTVP